jgi:hypothetical protein
MWAMYPILQKLQLAEDALVERRHSRATLRHVHTLEGATKEDVATYMAELDNVYREGNIVKDFVTNRKGGVATLQGDATLSDIGDILYLREILFPVPAAVYGYDTSLARDVMEEVRTGYYMLLDFLQDGISQVYADAFRTHLLLRGINPDAYDFSVAFAERRTTTRQQDADYALKIQALGASRETVYRQAGLEPAFEREQRIAEAAEADPYPMPEEIAAPKTAPKVSITPGNAPGGDSAVSITTRG